MHTHAFIYKCKIYSYNFFSLRKPRKKIYAPCAQDLTTPIIYPAMKIFFLFFNIYLLYIVGPFHVYFLLYITKSVVRVRSRLESWAMHIVF